ncbi:MAG: lipase maturation factor family protein [Gemmatimonadetes bacterium]|nr:lipase maturation factor family protein [Gemmatimonadota bacterium]
MTADWLLSRPQAILSAVDGVFGWIVGGADRGYTYFIARWLFLRSLGLVYLIAFLSFWVQAEGLIGADGILPARHYLVVMRTILGPERYRLLPTVFWLNASDRALHAACAAGVLCSVLLILDVAPALNLVLLWALYLSLVTAGQDFLSFQWDGLLLEAGFLAVFLASWRLLPGSGRAAPMAALALFLLWWLLFRLIFQSGLGKLTSGDPTWRDLTALHYHYLTQPLPTWTAWWMHQTPGWFKKLSVLATYVLEILVPLLIFGTRGMRLIACAGTVLLQLLILGTGNYCFFNLLTIALALLLVDDDLWTGLLPGGLGTWILKRGTAGAIAPPGAPLLLATSVVGTVAVVVGLIRIWQTLYPRDRLPAPVAPLVREVEPLRTFNSYGLFRVMTTRRPEIIVEGSQDGRTWFAYEFRHKPGSPTRRPGFVAPHQPRLDWQMWFAALGTYEQSPWFQALLVRLLEGSGDVLRLLARNPFPQAPPLYIRALLYDYRFTTLEERRAAGAWWTRELLGAYSPVLYREPVAPAPPR